MVIAYASLNLSEEVQSRRWKVFSAAACVQRSQAVTGNAVHAPPLAAPTQRTFLRLEETQHLFTGVGARERSCRCLDAEKCAQRRPPFGRVEDEQPLRRNRGFHLLGVAPEIVDHE